MTLLGNSFKEAPCGGKSMVGRYKFPLGPAYVQNGQHPPCNVLPFVRKQFLEISLDIIIFIVSEL